MNMAHIRNKTKYRLENGGQRIVEITGGDSRFGKRVILDFQQKSGLNKFNPELIAKKLKSLNERHQVFGLCMGALMWGYTVRGLLAV